MTKDKNQKIKNKGILIRLLGGVITIPIISVITEYIFKTVKLPVKDAKE
jgi:hypothetical protein